MPENSNCSGASSCSKESCEGCPSNAKNKAGGGIAKEPMNAASNVKKVIGVVSRKRRRRANHLSQHHSLQR